MAATVEEKLLNNNAIKDNEDDDDDDTMRDELDDEFTEDVVSSVSVATAVVKNGNGHQNNGVNGLLGFCNNTAKVSRSSIVASISRFENESRACEICEKKRRTLA